VMVKKKRKRAIKEWLETSLDEENEFWYTWCSTFFFE
jgi:hypothetical protein